MVPGYKDLTWAGTYHVLWDHVKELQGHTHWGEYGVALQYIWSLAIGIYHSQELTMYSGIM